MTVNPETPPPAQSSRSRMLWLFSAGLLIVALLWFLLWFFYLRYHESTDDAYANGNLVSLNAAVPGSVIAFYADDTDLVTEGQLLVELDPTAYQVAYEKALAELAAQALEVKQLYDTFLVKQTQVAIKKISFSKAQFDTDNRKQLIASRAISNEDFVHSQDDHSTAREELTQAELELQAAQDALGRTSLENHPRIEEKKKGVIEAYYNLVHCQIYAPTTGYVALRGVNVGESVAKNTLLLSIIPKDYVWVDANYKETQLAYMRIGQPATVWFDLYGSGVKFQGKVLGIASGTGSIFSLIPPQNATGNWIKIVQRLPVRISLDPELLKKYPMRLGISAEVTVNITDQNLPMLAQVPPTQPIGVTSVFNLNLEKVRQLIDEIVKSNLNL